jgi:hypothetical protein
LGTVSKQNNPSLILQPQRSPSAPAAVIKTDKFKYRTQNDPNGVDDGKRFTEDPQENGESTNPLDVKAPGIIMRYAYLSRLWLSSSCAWISLAYKHYVMRQKD